MADSSGCNSVSNEAYNVFYKTYTIDAPSLRCLAVNSAGDVMITWVLPVDTADYFHEYQLWHSSVVGGPFTLIHSANIYNTTSYIHTGANGNIQGQYYYLEILAGCNSNNVFNSESSDTLQSIFLTVGNANPAIATLNWNAMHVPNIPTASGIYEIYRKKRIYRNLDFVSDYKFFEF